MQNVFCNYNCYQNVLLIKIRNVDFYMIHILTENHLKNNNFTPCTQRVVKGARWPFRQSVRQYIISLGKHLRIYWASLVFVVIKSIKLYICAYLQDIPTRSRTAWELCIKRTYRFGQKLSKLLKRYLDSLDYLHELCCSIC